MGSCQSSAASGGQPVVPDALPVHILVTGEAGGGKTSFIHRICKMPLPSSPSNGSNLTAITTSQPSRLVQVNGQIIRLIFEEATSSLSYADHDADAVVLVADISKRHPFRDTYFFLNSIHKAVTPIAMFATPGARPRLMIGDEKIRRNSYTPGAREDDAFRRRLRMLQKQHSQSADDVTTLGEVLPEPVAIAAHQHQQQQQQGPVAPTSKDKRSDRSLVPVTPPAVVVEMSSLRDARDAAGMGSPDSGAGGSASRRGSASSTAASAAAAATIAAGAGAGATLQEPEGHALAQGQQNGSHGSGRGAGSTSTSTNSIAIGMSSASAGAAASNSAISTARPSTAGSSANCAMLAMPPTHAGSGGTQHIAGAGAGAQEGKGNISTTSTRMRGSGAGLGLLGVPDAVMGTTPPLCVVTDKERTRSQVPTDDSAAPVCVIANKFDLLVDRDATKRSMVIASNWGKANRCRIALASAKNNSGMMEGVEDVIKQLVNRPNSVLAALCTPGQPDAVLFKWM